MPSRPSLRLAAIAALGAAALCALPASASPTGSAAVSSHTSLSIATTAAGIDLPVSGVRGGWVESHGGDRARLHLNGLSATGTTTSVSAAWNSTCLPVQKISGFSASFLDGHRQFAPTTSDGGARLRIRIRHCGGDWLSTGVGRFSYPKNHPDLLEYTIVGVGLKALFAGSGGRLQFQVTLDDVVTDSSRTDQYLAVGVDRR